MGSLVDAVLVYIYMKYVHQWKDILSSEEVSNLKLESQVGESNEMSTNLPFEPSVESLEPPAAAMPQIDGSQKAISPIKSLRLDTIHGKNPEIAHKGVSMEATNKNHVGSNTDNATIEETYC